jgi:hypothetical protein
LRCASAKAAVTSALSIPLESWIEGSISSARPKLCIPFWRSWKPVM